MQWLILINIALPVYACVKKQHSQLLEAKAYLKYLDTAVCRSKNNQTIAEFHYFTNMSQATYDIVEAESAKPNFVNAEYKFFIWKHFNDSKMLRQAQFYKLLEGDTNRKNLEDFSEVLGRMAEAYSGEVKLLHENVSICDPINETIYSSPTNHQGMKYFWVITHEDRCKNIRPLFERLVPLGNTASEGKGFKNRADEWIHNLEMPPNLQSFKNFRKLILDIWNDVEGLYVQYYSYMRHKLRGIFGKHLIPEKGPIPVYFLGNEDGSKFLSVLPEMKPYPNRPSLEVDRQLVNQNYTVLMMVQRVEDFYKSLGFEPLPDTFWTRSIFTKTYDELFDDPISWDFYNRSDYRLTVAGEVDKDYLHIFVKELGRLHYWQSYKHQPCCFMEPVSPGVDEGIAKAMELAFFTYKHLSHIGLTSDPTADDKEVDLNSLFYHAMLGMSSLPTEVYLDLWRYDVQRGTIPKEKYNAAFWEYRAKFQGVVPPVGPRPEVYLDASENFQLIEDKPYVSYLFANILSYQFFEALCIEAGEYDPNNPNSKPLHKCNLCGKKKAGDLFMKLFRLGASKPWYEAIESVIGKSQLDTGPLLRYYKPLYDWFIEENKRTGEHIGWK